MKALSGGSCCGAKESAHKGRQMTGDRGGQLGLETMDHGASFSSGALQPEGCKRRRWLD